VNSKKTSPCRVGGRKTKANSNTWGAHKLNIIKVGGFKRSQILAGTGYGKRHYEIARCPYQNEKNGVTQRRKERPQQRLKKGDARLVEARHSNLEGVSLEEKQTQNESHEKAKETHRPTEKKFGNAKKPRTDRRL